MYKRFEDETLQFVIPCGVTLSAYILLGFVTPGSRLGSNNKKLQGYLCKVSDSNKVTKRGDYAIT